MGNSRSRLRKLSSQMPPNPPRRYRSATTLASASEQYHYHYTGEANFDSVINWLENIDSFIQEHQNGGRETTNSSLDVRPRTSVPYQTRNVGDVESLFDAWLEQVNHNPEFSSNNNTRRYSKQLAKLARDRARARESERERQSKTRRNAKSSGSGTATAGKTRGKAPNEEICVIDQEPIVAAARNSLVLPCAHKFHRQCIQEWLKESNTCPICRSPADEHLADDCFP